MECVVVNLPPQLTSKRSSSSSSSSSNESPSSSEHHIHASLRWMQETCHRMQTNDETMTRFNPPIPLQDSLVEYFANALNGNHTITEIEWKHPNLTKSSMACLLEAAVLTPMSAVKVIRMSHPQRKAVLSEVIFETMLAPNCSAVETIDISSDVMGVACAKQLGEVLASDSTHLVELRLTNNEWINRRLALTQLLNGLRSNTTLRILSLSGSKVNDTVAVALAAVIEQHPTLQELDLNDNHIGDTGITILAAALVAQRRHYLSYKQQEQRKALIQSYKEKNPAAATKNVSSKGSVSKNSKGSDSKSAAGSTSTDSTASTSSSSSASSSTPVVRTCLRSLKLSWNRIGDKGLKALADQLPLIKDLEAIELYHNPRVTKIGLRVLLDGLKQSSHVHHVMLSYEQREVDKDASDEIEFLCQLHRLRAHRTKYAV